MAVLSNAEIADRLFVATATVKTHVHAFSPSLASATGFRRWCSPTRAVSCSRAKPRREPAGRAVPLRASPQQCSSFLSREEQKRRRLVRRRGA